MPLWDRGRGMQSGFNTPTPGADRLRHAKDAQELAVKILLNLVVAQREGRRLPPLDLEASQTVVHAGSYMAVREDAWRSARHAVIQFLEKCTEASVAATEKRKLDAAE